MRYYLYEEQDGGCDYTIGCGRRLRLLEGATSLADALRMATEKRTNKWGDCESLIKLDRDDSPNRARVLAVAEEVAIDLDSLANERSRAAEAARQKAREEAERAEYERLKGKFG